MVRDWPISESIIKKERERSNTRLFVRVERPILKRNISLGRATTWLRLALPRISHSSDKGDSSLGILDILAIPLKLGLFEKSKITINYFVWIDASSLGAKVTFPVS